MTSFLRPKFRRNAPSLFRSRAIVHSLVGLMVVSMLLQTVQAETLISIAVHEREAERAQQEAAREMRLFVRAGLSVGGRTDATLDLMRKTAERLASPDLEREKRREAFGDLDMLAGRLEELRAQVSRQIGRTRARLMVADVDQVVLDTLDERGARVDARFDLLWRQAKLAYARRDDERARVQLVERLKTSLSPDHPEAPAPRQLRRRPLINKSEPARTMGEPPIFEYPVAFAAAGASGPLEDLLDGLDPVSGDPEAADTEPSAPVIDFERHDLSLCGTGAGDPVYCKAASLDFDPVAIFEFVRNELAYEPYFGSTKGARRTLEEGRGNDADLAALLVAMLRASDVPARLTFGTIELTEADAASWLAVDDASRAFELLRRNGVPADLITEPGAEDRISVDHVWVKAHVNQFPLRAERGQDEPVAGDTWVDLDPSFKKHHVSGTTLRGALSLSPSALLTNMSGGATFGTDPASVTNLDEQGIADTLSVAAGPVRDFLAAEALDVESAFRRVEVAEEQFGLLPVTDFYTITSRGMTLRDMPEALTRRARIIVEGPGTTEAISYDAFIGDLASGRVTIAYTLAENFEGVPGALTDQGRVVDALAYSVVPRLYVDGALAPGSGDPTPVQLGSNQTLVIEFDDLTSGSTAAPAVRQEIAAGGVHAIVVASQDKTETDINVVDERLDNLALEIGAEGEDVSHTIAPGKWIGEMLHAVGTAHLYRAARLGDMTAGDLAVRVTRHPSAVLVSWDVTALGTIATDTAIDAAADRVRTRILRDVSTAVGVGEDVTGEARFHISAAALGDAIARGTLEQMLRTGADASAYSAGSIIRMANKQPPSLPILTLEPGVDPSSHLGTLDVALRAQIVSDVLAGREVTILTQEIASSDNVDGWTEAEYLAVLVRDPASGATDLELVRKDGIEVDAELSTAELTEAGLAIDPDDLLRNADDKDDLAAALLDSAAQWTRVAVDATHAMGLWTAPAAIHVHDWYADRTESEPATPVATLLMMASPVLRFSEHPAIFNVAAEAGTTDTEGNWLASPTGWASIDFPDVRIVGEVTRGGVWEIRVKDLQAPTPTAQGSSREIDVVLPAGDGTGDPVSPFGEGTNAFTITAAASGNDATPVSGAVSVDVKAPAIDGLAAAAGQYTIPNEPPQGLGHIEVRAFVDDTYLRDWSLFMTPDGGEETLVQTSTTPYPTPPGYTGTETPPVIAIVPTTHLDVSSIEFRMEATDLAGNTIVAPPQGQSVAAQPLNPPLPESDPPAIAFATYDAGAWTEPADPLLLTAQVDLRLEVDDEPTPGASGLRDTDGVQVVFWTDHPLASPIVLDDEGIPGVRISTTPFGAAEYERTITLDPAVLPGGRHALIVDAVDRRGNAARRILTLQNNANGINNFVVDVAATTEPNVQSYIEYSADLPSSVTDFTEWRFEILPHDTDDATLGTASPIAIAHHGAPPATPTVDAFPVDLAIRQDLSAQFPFVIGSVDAALTSPASGDDFIATGAQDSLQPGDYLARISVHDTSGVAHFAVVPFEYRTTFSPIVAEITTPATTTNDIDVVGATGGVGDPSVVATPINAGFFELHGNVYDEDPGDFVEYSVSLRRLGAVDPAYVARAPTETQERWVFEPYVQGQDPSELFHQVEDDTLTRGDPGFGVFLGDMDATLVESGIYELVLTVANTVASSDPNDEAHDVVRIALTNTARVGELAFSQQDLVAQSGAVPISVVRSYSSFDRYKDGPFGAGWSLSLYDLEIDLGEDRRPASEFGLEPVDFSTPDHNIRSGAPFDRSVTLTLPDGQRATFASTFVPDRTRQESGVPAQYYKLEYLSPPGVRAKLTATTSEYLTLPIGSQGDFGIHWENAGVTGFLMHHDVSGWTLELEDGTTYDIKRDVIVDRTDGNDGVQYEQGFINGIYGEPYVSSIDFPSGESIVLDVEDTYGVEEDNVAPDGVEQLSPTRVVSQAVHIDYNAEGKIKAIYQPGAYTDATHAMPPSFIYEYGLLADGLTRVLTKVHRVTDAGTWDDQAAPTASDATTMLGHLTTEKTTFTYVDDRIDSIIDPRGLQPIIMEYDESGRLVATVDALGNRTALTRDIDTRVEMIISPGNPPSISRHIYDERGNVIRTIDATGTTDREYNDHGQVTLEQLPHQSRPSTFTYNQYGDRTSATNPAGDTTTYDYAYASDPDPSDSIPGDLLWLTITAPDGSMTKTVFDQNRNAIELVAAGVRTVNTYDDQNRVISTSVGVLNADTPLPANGEAAIAATENVDVVLQSEALYDNDPQSPTFGLLLASRTFNSETDDADVTFEYPTYDGLGNQIGSNSLVEADGALYRVSSLMEYDYARRLILSKRRVDKFQTLELAGVGRNVTLDASLLSTVVQAAVAETEETVLSRTVYDAGRAIAQIDFLRNTVRTTRTDMRGHAIETVEWPGLADDIADPATGALRADAWIGQLFDWLVDKRDGIGDPVVQSITFPSETIDPIVRRTLRDDRGRVRYTADSVRVPAAALIQGASTHDITTQGEERFGFGSASVYDEANRVERSERVDALGLSIVGSADPAGGWIVVRDPGVSPHVRSFATTEYNARGFVSRSTNADGSPTDFRYDDAGRRTHVIRYEDDGTARATMSTYDTQGRLKTTTGPDDAETTFHYDAFGRRVGTTLPDGEQVRTVYDGRGRHIATIDQLDQRTDYRYDLAGRLTDVFLPETNTYAAAGDTAVRQRPHYQYAHDHRGNQTRIIDPNGHVTTFAYDFLGRQIRRTLPDADGDGADDDTETMGYDAQGRVIWHVDFVGTITINAYDPESGLLMRTSLYPANAFDPAVDPEPDPSLNTDHVRYTHTYNGRWRLETVEREVFHDPNDLYIVDAPVQTVYHYDDEGRVDQIDRPEGIVGYAYDPVTGRKDSTTAASNTTDFGYDGLGRLETVSRGDRTYTYGYDEAGRRRTLTASDTTLGHISTATWGYDAVGRLKTLEHVSPLSSTITYTYGLRADGRRTGLEEKHGSDVVRDVTYQYDELNRLTEELSTPGVGATDPDALDYLHEYFFDAAGNRVRKRETGHAGFVTHVDSTYDARDRLLTETRTGAAQTSYGWDDNGFMTSKVGPDGTFAYAPNLRGRMAIAQVQSPASGDPQRILFDYDPNGTRVARNALDWNSTTSLWEDPVSGHDQFLIDPMNLTGHAQVAHETTAVGTRSYVIGDDVLSQTDGSSAPRDFVYDGHGSTTFLRTGSGGLESGATFRYDAYGNAVGFDTESALPTSLLYCGEVYDQSNAVQMTYLRARWLMPSNGRFGRVDPFAGISDQPLTLAKYAYVHGDPVNASDPTGLFFVGASYIDNLFAMVRWAESIARPHVVRFLQRRAVQSLFAGTALGGIAFAISKGLGGSQNQQIRAGVHGAVAGVFLGIVLRQQNQLGRAIRAGVVDGVAGVVGLFVGTAIARLHGQSWRAWPTQADYWDAFIAGFSGGVMSSVLGSIWQESELFPDREARELFIASVTASFDEFLLPENLSSLFRLTIRVLLQGVATVVVNRLTEGLSASDRDVLVRLAVEAGTAFLTNTASVAYLGDRAP